MSYTPIDYSNWELGDSARNGVNIKKLDLLNPNELEILNATTPYQDQRNDPGHGELTAYFAIKLLDDIPGTREVVVPAAILHDSGWWGVDPDYWKNLFYIIVSSIRLTDVNHLVERGFKKQQRFKRKETK